MKRTFFIIGIFVAALTTSCDKPTIVKQRICKCISLVNPSANYNYTYEMIGSAKAKADCENQQTSGRTTQSPDYTCEIE